MVWKVQFVWKRLVANGWRYLCCLQRLRWDTSMLTWIMYLHVVAIMSTCECLLWSIVILMHSTAAEAICHRNEYEFSMNWRCLNMHSIYIQITCTYQSTWVNYMKPRINMSSCAIGFSGAWQNSLVKLSIRVCSLNFLGELWPVSNRFVSWTKRTTGCVFSCFFLVVLWKLLFLSLLLSCGFDTWLKITSKKLLMKVDPCFGSSIILVPADLWATCVLWGRLAESQA